jgi:hypothetical protein
MLNKTWQKFIDFLLKYAQRAKPTRDKGKDKQHHQSSFPKLW